MLRPGVAVVDQPVIDAALGVIAAPQMLPLRIPWYVTVLDLGPAGAVYTEGWDRVVVSEGAAAPELQARP